MESGRKQTVDGRDAAVEPQGWVHGVSARDQTPANTELEQSPKKGAEAPEMQVEHLGWGLAGKTSGRERGLRLLIMFQQLLGLFTFILEIHAGQAADKGLFQ